MAKARKSAGIVKVEPDGKHVTVVIPPGQVQARLSRPEVSEERERVALELFVHGANYTQIGEVLAIAPTNALYTVRRGLAKRAEEVEGETVERARTLYLERLQALLEAWMPRALGKHTVYGEPATEPVPAAATIVLQVLDRYARVFGLERTPILATNNSQTVVVNVQTAHDDIMRSLDDVIRRRQVVEGELGEGSG